jgi:hypothetical protein
LRQASSSDATEASVSGSPPQARLNSSPAALPITAQATPAAGRKVITNLKAENVELDELQGFAGAKSAINPPILLP